MLPLTLMPTFSTEVEEMLKSAVKTKEDLLKKAKKIGKIMRKNKIKKEYFPEFTVVTEGYAYFFKSNTDKEYHDCVFIRNAIVSEIDDINNPPNTIEIESRYTHEFFSFRT